MFRGLQFTNEMFYFGNLTFHFFHSGVPPRFCPTYCSTKEDSVRCYCRGLHLTSRYVSKMTLEVFFSKYFLGSMVQINLYSLHRKKEIWIDPENFRPERFLKDGAVVQVARQFYFW